MGNQGHRWIEARVVHCGDSPVQFVIEGVRGETPASDIAVDKVCIFACSGPESTPSDPQSTIPPTSDDVSTTGIIIDLPSTIEASSANTSPEETPNDPQSTIPPTLDDILTPGITTDLPSTIEASLANTCPTESILSDSTLDWSTLTPSVSSTRPPQILQCHVEEIPKDYITRCDFNDNLRPYCQWTQECDTDSGEWIRTNGETPTQHTGPSADQPAPWGDGVTHGHYVYEEASNFVANQFIRLTSPSLNISGDVCIEFSYHMYGPLDEGGTLNVLVAEGPSTLLLWNRTVPQSHAWLSGAVTVPGSSSRSIRVIFEAVRGLTEVGDIALDNVAVVTGPCFCE
ncbi:MAM and LDL-receptor class A domain-containing protein 1-like [Chiloscyllium plagiosum]|uniref:MAM and LDL-receptor class A domain-containing protein 1-like n=1 Tax=Chiloscyllium plagiosum TaxID=36176 RepID=UPI001CB80F72|nr:MAM and LDL-receptor class A domain-containing protein 1-like [Chiloscyllium plagiosum]